MTAQTKLNEEVRRVVCVTGVEKRLTGVKSLDTTGSWTRIECDQGYVIINQENVLMYIVRGEKTI